MTSPSPTVDVGAAVEDATLAAVLAVAAVFAGVAVLAATLDGTVAGAVPVDAGGTTGWFGVDGVDVVEA